ncbi:RNA polymerase sigma factor [Ovoidimarina sediminis]|uniref:RNA polymerase sigma factor n=1 Tax=Ovoidimarina sediminis TaxID=3079856 RepID=UPI00290D65E4|nr:RNA polymerase sigma factor [Rhodophyticola sp. MJ-SS7]MDU8942248.1 RNA polymerase sigma factor [Rhodophyticola sp. MJ-SS7]
MQGDDRADLLMRLRPKLLRRARRYTRDPATAEDMVQEALLRVWLRMSEDPPITNLEAYLVTALRRIAMRPPPAFDALPETLVPGVPDTGTDRVAAREVGEALDALPAEQSVLLLGVAVGGESYATLARAHNIPIGTVMSRVSRGRAALREMLDLPKDRPVSALLGRR